MLGGGAGRVARPGCGGRGLWGLGFGMALLPGRKAGGGERACEFWRCVV